MYLRPVYAAEEGSSRFTLKKVVVASGERVGFGDTVELAMADLLDAETDGAADDPTPTDDPGTDPDEGSTSTTTTVPGDRTPTELLAEADRLFTEAEQRLADGDLAGYDDLVTQRWRWSDRPTASSPPRRARRRRAPPRRPPPLRRAELTTTFTVAFATADPRWVTLRGGR